MNLTSSAAGHWPGRRPYHCRRSVRPARRRDHHIIDLTPDAETPDFDEAAAVRAAGLSYANLPIAGAADLNPESVDAFDQLLRGTQGPTLVHCASGNRAGALAALRAAWLQGADEEAAIAEGRRWGLRSLEGEVREQLARER